MPNNMHAFENKQKAMTHFRNKRKWTANNVDLRGRIALMTDCLSDKNTFMKLYKTNKVMVLLMYQPVK